MTFVLGLLLLALGTYYAGLLGAFGLGLRRTIRHRHDPLPDSECPSVTVIVPARNEEATLGACLDSILAVDYPSDRIEVIAVDDDSSDATASVVRERMHKVNAPAACLGPIPASDASLLSPPSPETNRRLRLVEMPENRSRLRAHKKRAIEKAVSVARGEIILTTDADCVVPPQWVRRLTAPFADEAVAFVSGPVRYAHHPSLPMRLQALDFFGLMCCGAGSLSIGLPTLANGACVAYRRRAFEALGGFSDIDRVTSGDDELLMQKIAYQTPLDVTFCAAPDATVVTEPVRTLSDFVHQRRRWASKGSHYPPRLVLALAGLLLFFGVLTASLLALPWMPELAPFVLGALALKATGDLSVLLPGARHFGLTSLLRVFPLHLLLHAPHSVMVGISGPFGGYRWKDRSIDR